MDLYSSRYYQMQGDSPARNLRSKAGHFSEKYAPYALPPTPGNPTAGNPTAHGRSMRSKRIYNSPLEEDLDLVGKTYPDTPMGLQTPQHFMNEDSPNKFLDLDTPDKQKVAFSLQETAPLSFDCVLDPVVPLNDYCFSGLVEHMQVEPYDKELDTPQGSPLSSPFSNETTNPYTPFTDSEPPPTPQAVPTPSMGDYAVSPLSETERPSGRRSKRVNIKVKQSPSSGQEEEQRVPTKRSHRKSPLKEISSSTRIELPPTPEESEWHQQRDGCIKELHLRNFMCHTNKIWKFSPHLNIITGLNGSGKTAIQTAIMIACGANASHTGRADSLPLLVQRGESCAVIKIILTNYHGTHSKRKYGEEIVIRTTISRHTKSTKVQVRDGSWVNFKKPALDSLLRPLQIHFTNPVQILTQKVATNFLHSQEPAALYKSFEDITEITSAEKFLQASMSNMYSVKTKLGTKNQDYMEKKRLAEEAQKKHEQILEMKKYVGLCARLRRERGWAHVIQAEATVKDLEGRVSEIDAKIAGLEKDKANLEKSKEDIVSSHEREKSMLSELRRDASNLEAQHDTAHEAVRELNKETQSIEKRIKLLHQSKAKISQELQDIERQRRDSLSVKANDDERIKNQAEEEKRRYLDTIDDASQQLGELRTEKVEKEQHYSVCNETTTNYERQFQETQGRLKDKIKSLRNIKDAEVTRYEKFGHRVKEIVKRIDQYPHWAGSKPIGPVGAWVTVKKEYESYAPAIEQAIVRTLWKFVVDHGDDVNTLRMIIQDTFGNSNEAKPSCFYVEGNDREKHGEWWSRGKAVIKGYPTILDVLDIQHPKVTEGLIENEQIEKVILFETEDEACHICKDRSRVPQACMYGLSKSCYKFTPVPNYKAQPLQLRKKANILQTTRFETPREALENEIECLKAEAAEINVKLQDAKKNGNGFLRAVHEVDAQIRSKIEEINRAKSLLRRCEQILAELEKTSDVANQTDFLEEQQRQHELTLAQRDEELATQVTLKAESDRKLKEREKESKGLKAQLEELRRRIQACDDETGAFQKEVEKKDKKIRECDSNIKSLKADQKKIQKDMDTKNADLSQKVREASKFGERMETNRTPEQITSDLEGRETFYRQNLPLIKSDKDVIRTAKKMRKAAADIHVKIEFVNDLLTSLQPLSKYQMEHLKTTRIALLNNFDNYYQAFVKLRGYTGQVLFDINEKKLVYYLGVDKEGERKARAYIKRDPGTHKLIVDWKGIKDFVKLLSGGESSFSTMSYISGLRQLMHCPFFMLDEYEVFMDGGNKKVCMEILVDQSHSLFDAQFFVFTPHEPEELPNDSYIKLFRLIHTGRNIQSSPTGTPEHNEGDDGPPSQKRRRK